MRTVGEIVLVLMLMLLVGAFCKTDDLCASSSECVMSPVSSNGCKVNCSHMSVLDNKLTSVPTDLPSSTTILVLDYNVITVIKPHSFSRLHRLQTLTIRYNKIANFNSPVLSSLQLLDLSDNHLSRIDRNMFRGLEGLVELCLSFNNITTIERDSFKDLVNLTILDIHNNSLKIESDRSVPLHIFAPLAKLKTLWIHNNRDPAYRGDLVTNLAALKHLRLDGPRNHTNFCPPEYRTLTALEILLVFGDIMYVTNDTFANLEHCPIEELGIFGGELIDMEPNALMPFHSLRILALSDNPLLSLCNVSHAWPGLQGKLNLTELYLDQVMDFYSNEALVPCNFFKKLDPDVLKNIKILSLEANNLVQIDRQFVNLASLSEFSLNSNRMQKIDRIECLEKHEVEDRPMPTPCYLTCETKLPTPKINITDGTLYLPVSIRILSLNAATNYDVLPIPPLTIIGCHALEVFSMNNNAISDFKGPINFTSGSPNKGLSISLTGNDASSLHPEFLANIHVTQLNVTGNKLGNNLWSDVHGKTFKDLQNLTLLNLADNEIKTLPPKIFQHLTKVELLNLSHNALIAIDFSICNMTKLTMLDLNENIFVTLSKNETDRLDRQGNLTVDLVSNPLVCSCDYLEFLEWIFNLNSKTRKPNWRTFQCHYRNRYIRLGEMYDVYYYTEFIPTCRSRAYLVKVCVCLAVFVVCLTLLIVSYRYRWDIKFFLTQLIYRKQFEEISQDDQVYEYNAFVAYHQDDFQWVRFQLIHHLERVEFSSSQNNEQNGQQRGSFRLCVHHRDFMPGSTIEENIIESIQRSYKTIIVLSKSFVESGWCQFELQMARMNCFDKKKNNIVVIVLEPIPMHLMSTSLQILLRRTTFIEWPFSPVHRDLFWDRLRNSLRGPSQPVLCDCGHAMKSRWSVVSREQSSE